MEHQVFGGLFPWQGSGPITNVCSNAQLPQHRASKAKLLGLTFKNCHTDETDTFKSLPNDNVKKGKYHNTEHLHRVIPMSTSRG